MSCLKRPKSGDWPVAGTCAVEGRPASCAETTTNNRREVRSTVASFILLSPRETFDGYGRYMSALMLCRTFLGRRSRARFIAYAVVATFTAMASEIFLMSFKGG